jgi:processive 1,2-diacylglycerol beta-glucosyltransferase
MAGLEEVAPRLNGQFLDAVKTTPKLFRNFYSGGYNKCMTHLPRLWGIAFRVANRSRGRRHNLLERSRLAWERRMLRKLRCYLLEVQPKLIVHTHFLAPNMVGRLIRQNKLHAKHFVVVTDCQAHRFWYARNVHRYFVQTEQAVETLREWGIDRRAICQSGIPIHPKWTKPLDRNKLLDKWSLPADKQIIVLAGGAAFTTGPISRIAADLERNCPEAFVVVLAGHNEKLLSKLERLSKRLKRLRGIPMTDRANEIVELCSLMVTKPGGISTAECVAKGKPMVFLPPVPGQEEGNADYYAARGAAITSRSWNDVTPLATELLKDKPRLRMMANNAKTLYRPATQIISKAIVEELSENTNPQ